MIFGPTIKVKQPIIMNNVDIACLKTSWHFSFFYDVLKLFIYCVWSTLNRQGQHCLTSCLSVFSHVNLSIYIFITVLRLTVCCSHNLPQNLIRQHRFPLHASHHRVKTLYHLFAWEQFIYDHIVFLYNTFSYQIWR